MRRLLLLIVLVFYASGALAQEAGCVVSADPLPYFNKVLSKSKSVAQKFYRKNTVATLYPATALRVQGRVDVVARRGNPLATPEALADGAVLHLGDVLQTYEQSFISLRLGDGTVSTLPSNSRIELARSSRSVARFVLQKGTVESGVRKNDAARKNTFEIQIPNAIVGVRGTHFRVHYEQNYSTAEVSDGTVWVQPRHVDVCHAPLVIKAGEGARLDNLSGVVAAYLLPAPQLIGQENAQKNELVAFTVAPVAGAVRYHAQVAADEGFLDVQTEVFSDSPNVVLKDESLRNGFYYVKLTAIDETGLEGLAGSYLFLRARE